MPDTQRKIKIASAYAHLGQPLDALLERFAAGGNVLQDKRNTIKQADLNGSPVVVKSFKVPSLVQGFIYANLRPSKARRSYEHAERLLALGVGTHEPIAYVEYFRRSRLQESFFISAWVQYDFTIGDVLNRAQGVDLELIRKFAEFTFSMHQVGVLHLDHSPGNTLITKTAAGYRFAVVDVNRMRFGSISLKRGLRNFLRLTDNPAVLRAFAETYAANSNADPDRCHRLLLKYKKSHNRKVRFRRGVKRYLKRLTGGTP